MKIGEAHRTQSSSLYSANTIGAPMHPAAIGVADQTQTKNYWCTVSGQHCLLARGTSEHQPPIYWRTDAPCVGRYHTEATSPTQLLALDNVNFTLPNGGPNSLMRLAFIHANCLLTGFTKRKRKQVEEKITTKLKSKQTSIATVRNHLRTVQPAS